MSLAQEAPISSPTEGAFQGDDFHYAPIPVLVPISLGFIFLSLLAALTAELLLVPVVGATTAFLAIRQIQKSMGNLSGARIAWCSLVLQVIIAVSFGLMHVYSFVTELPPGYERINFTSDISKKGFTTEGGLMGIHPDVQKLESQKVMLKGYMYPWKSTEGIRSFVLCRDNGDCCFGGQPKTTDMVLVHMKGDTFAKFQKGMVAVAGVFRVEPTVDETGLKPVYQLECDYFGPAKTWY
ncbi:MAG: hypothetical protein U0941_06055 [Planctomycetaceae bacterium]